MPVRNAATCKWILDGGASAKAAAESATTMMIAVGANVLEGTVAETEAGEKWLKKVKETYAAYDEHGQKFVEKFADLCMTQPVAE